MLDLARRINAEEIAVREHIPDRKAIYVLVTDLEKGFIEIKAEDFAKDKELRVKDYYSCVININKCVDKKKKIHSNNKYTLFIKEPSKVTEDIIRNYYEALDCDLEESQRYISWFFKNQGKLEKYKKPIKVFFEASVEQIIELGKEYFYKNVFADVRNTDFANGDEIGAPLTLNTNEKKPFQIKNPTKGKYSAMYAKEDCFRIKCVLDLFKSLILQGYDKAYFYKDTYVPVKFGQILQEDIPPSTFVRFGFNSRGTINILDWEVIGAYVVHKWAKKMFYYYKSIDSIFLNEDLYSIITDNISSGMKNAREKHLIANMLQRWFIKGIYPNVNTVSQIERQLVNISKNEFSEDYEKTITRTYFIKEILDCLTE